MYVQSYCVQQYTMVSMAKHILGMIVKAADEKATPMDPTAHGFFLEGYRMLQSGGGPISKAMKKSLVFLLLLVYCVADTSVIIGTMDVENVFSEVSKSSNMETISAKIGEYMPLESIPVSVRSTIYSHDEKLDKDLSGFGNFLYYLFHALPPSGEEKIIEYVEEFNDLMNGYASTATKECRQIVEDVYERGMFANYKTSSEIDQLEKEYDLLVEKQKQNKEDTQIGLKQTVASATAAAISGDFYTPFAMMYNTIEHVVNKPAEKLAVYNKKTAKYVPEELLKTAKVYCASSFHLEIEYSEKEQTLKLIGDKISYESMRVFTSSVIQNMKLVQKTTDSTSENESVFKSIEQRMKTIEYIVDHLEHMVTMGMMNELPTKLKARSKNPISIITDYFDKQTEWMDTTILTMGEMFPIDARKIRQDILAKEAKSGLASKQTKEQTRIASEYYVNMIHSYSMLLRKPLSAAVASLTATVLDVPTGLVETTTDKLSEMLTNMVRIMMKSPGGIILLSFCSMAFFILVSVALNSIRMIGSFLYIPFSPFIWVTKVGVRLGSTAIQSMAVLTKKTPTPSDALVVKSKSPSKRQTRRSNEVVIRI